MKSAKLEITFLCPFLEQCTKQSNDPAAISSERANLTLSCFMIEASLHTAQIITKDRHPSIHLPSKCTCCAYKHQFLTLCPFFSGRLVMCHALLFLLPIFWKDALFSWWLNRDIWCDDPCVEWCGNKDREPLWTLKVGKKKQTCLPECGEYVHAVCSHIYCKE